MSIVTRLVESRVYLEGSQVRKVDKGWSQDEKYVVSAGQGQYLLSVFPEDKYEKKVREFEILKRMVDLGVKASRPVEMGQEGDVGYILVEYIEGQDGEDILPLLSEEEQYRIGTEAGQELWRMHQLAAPEELASWYERKKRKHQRYVEAYWEFPYRLRNDEKILAFIDENLELMRDRPNIFQHDDYHVGNIILDQGKVAGVIDFELMDWGDPWHDFVKLGTVSRETSIPFCIGQIQGYLGTDEPNEVFWRLYAMYHAMAAIATVVWIQRYYEGKMEEAMGGIGKMLEDHEYFELIRPSWWKSRLG